MTDDDSHAHELQRSLRNYLDRQGLTSLNALAVVATDWSEVAGEQLAAHSKPVALTNARLVVEVDHPAWATELRIHAKTLLIRLENSLGPAVITDIEVRIQRNLRIE